MRLVGENLSVQRGGRTVFRQLDFAARAGHPLLVTGPNGAGKSTLLRLIGGLLPEKTGKLVLEGGDPELTIPEQAHYFGHQDALKSSLTVKENLDFWQRFYGQPKLSPYEALGELAIDHLIDLPAAYLSAGQRRRLSLARLLVCKRPIWLMDEPQSALDTASEKRLIALMEEHIREGGLLIAATHLELNVTEPDRLAISAVHTDEADFDELDDEEFNACML